MAQFGGPKLVKALHFDNTAKENLVKGINKIPKEIAFAAFTNNIYTSYPVNSRGPLSKRKL